MPNIPTSCSRTGYIDMLDNPVASEDLKAFERRLTEILACYQPQTKRWRIILLMVTLTTSITASQWLFDPETGNVSLMESLHNHLFFTLNCIAFVLLIIFGVHRKVVAPSIIVTRIKSVLENFNMSCDHNGRLILKRASSTYGTTTITTPGNNGNHFWSAADPFRQLNVLRTHVHNQ